MKSNLTTYYVEVAPAVPLSATGRQTYTYYVENSGPLECPRIVKIPFGQRQILGVALKSTAAKPSFPTKEGKLVPLPATITQEQLEFARQIATIMHGGLGYTLRLFLPPSGKYAEKDQAVSSVTATQTPPSAQELYALSAKKNVALIESDSEKRRTLLLQTALQYVGTKKQMAIIVPEVSLLEPMTELMQTILPSKRVALYRAGLPVAEMKRVWYGVKNGDIAVVIGTQKTLFLPWKNLEVIAIEQEYYPTHKLWDQYPRLHNVQASYLLANIFSAQVLLAGSFPSLELHKKIADQQSTSFAWHPNTPAVTIIASQFLDKRQRHFLPQEFVRKLTSWAKREQRIFLLCNKRGAWQVALCRVCHKAHRCPNCGVSMLAHKVSKRTAKKSAYELVCRQCGIHSPLPPVCTSCHKGKLQFIRPGGETIETILRELLPRRSLLRLDTDTLSGRTTESVAKDIAKSQIILGTNAALTQLEGTHVDQAVWLFPEDTLLFPDIRSSERAWYTAARLQQLVKPSASIIAVTRYQSLVEDVFKKGSDAFVAKELASRRRLSYPPFTDMVRLTWHGKTQAAVSKKAEAARHHMEKRIHDKKIIMRGPYDSLTARGVKEAHILLLGALADLPALYQDLAVDVVDSTPERIL